MSNELPVNWFGGGGGHTICVKGRPFVIAIGILSFAKTVTAPLAVGADLRPDDVTCTIVGTKDGRVWVLHSRFLAGDASVQSLGSPDDVRLRVARSDGVIRGLRGTRLHRLP